MPKNFPDIWVGRVEKKLTSIDQAPWLDGISEINAEIIVLGEGTDTEKNMIYLPTTDFSPSVFINNTAYPLALEDYSDDTLTINLDKYQTAQTSVSDDDAMGSSYDKIDSAVGCHITSITEKKYVKAIHALAPASDSEKTPVVKTTGANDGAGRKIFMKKDIIALKKKFDKAGIPTQGRRLVLCPDHIADLLENDQKFADQYYNYTTGKISNLYSFQVFEYVENPYFNAETGAKKSFGSVPTDGDYQASVAFYEKNVGKKTGKTKQYFTDAKNNTATQSNLLNYRHYFICVPKRPEYIGAIISDLSTDSNETIEITPETMSFAAAGETKLAAVTATSAYEVSVTGTGFSVSKDGNAVSVVAAANIGAQRTGTVTVKVTADQTKTATIALTQLAGN
jgi:hypothetical protein